MADWRLRLAAACLMLWLAPTGSTLAQDAETAAVPQSPPPLEIPQPAYEVLRVEDGGVPFSYRVWEEWVPQVVTTPDGGAWTFFTAQARTPDGYGSRRLFAARFDPAKMVWLPATAMPGDDTQFGASAVVDSKGVVHLVYSDRVNDNANAWSQLVYTRFVDGAWSVPAQVAPDPNAGHQMLASLAIDKKDGLHVVWRDQRFVSPEARLALPTNADILGSDYVNGAWTTPVQINTREAPDVNPAWPHLAVDNDRLVLVWSIYKGTTADEMRSAARVEWSTRALDASAKWTTPQVLFERQSGDAGGRLIDLAADPRGGAVVVYGLYNHSNNELFMQRLAEGSDAWSKPTLIASGDYGYLPRLTIAADGTVYVVFNNGRNRDVDIGGLMTDPSGHSAGPVTLTPADGGVTARASIALDSHGSPWVVYLHQLAGTSNVTEIRSLRAATFVPPSSP